MLGEEVKGNGGHPKHRGERKKDEPVSVRESATRRPAAGRGYGEAPEPRRCTALSDDPTGK